MTGYIDWEKEIERLEEVIGEQQAKIHRDEMSIKTMMSNMEKLEKENEQLRQKLDFYLLDEFEWKEKYGD